ncbi:psbP domain-containing protein 3, chloroplastic [Phragmites australis]|uniref:psbP domain-containing protein 3, chloroplastic n=1 Tax=Phragmites australis TaxID=29695 RepID=UPI002D79CFD8|nr:psbP domain-containing protein 3, chloroplastic [Phragmites australis]
MAAVTSTSSLCPAGLSSLPSFIRLKPRSHRKLPTTTVCHCRPARMEGLDRREALLGVLLSAAASAAAPALAPADALADGTELQEGFSTYEDEANKFSITIPQGWLVGAGEASGIKSVTAFYPEQAADSNVSVVITGIGPDFTSLKSFGDVDAFAETLVNGLDRSWQRPPGLAAKLIHSRAANGLYYVEYTLQNPGERRRHILSAIGMAFNGWYNRLYTVTGQYIDDESDKYRPQIEKAVQSFKLT